MAVLAGTDFFTVEVLTWRGLATYYVLFFIHLETRRISLAGLTRHPTREWMVQMARNASDESSGFLRGHRYVLHDRDTKFCAAFQDVLRSSRIEPWRFRRAVRISMRSPNAGCDPLRRNVYPNSFCLGKRRYDGRWVSSSSITTVNGTRSTTCFSSLVRKSREFPTARPFGAANASADY